MMARTWPVHSARFFMLQGVAIVAESLVIAFTRELGIDARVKRWIGYVWVLVWFLYSVDLEFAGRMLDHGLAPSVIGPMWAKIR